ncbi:MAG: hypothetical protein CL942_14175 [Desulfovibrio sp.]|nr:hypothetical protein [Desulfovibrio sp.]|tara:strand:+ start:6073 stop:6294 length:222 start_codon:yes stop_codon:yes gene_type:complete
MGRAEIKSRDLSPDRARCADEDCRHWASDCARAEHQLGQGRFIWMAVGQRLVRGCSRRIDPATLVDVEDKANF